MNFLHDFSANKYKKSPSFQTFTTDFFRKTNSFDISFITECNSAENSKEKASLLGAFPQRHLSVKVQINARSIKFTLKEIKTPTGTLFVELMNYKCIYVVVLTISICKKLLLLTYCFCLERSR